MYVEIDIQPLQVENVWSLKLGDGIQKEKDFCRFIEDRKQAKNICYKLSSWRILHLKNNR